MFTTALDAWDVGQTSITALSFQAAVIVASVVACVGTVVLGRRRRFVRWSGAMITPLCLLIAVAVGINNHYAYLPNLASLWGWRAADQTSWSAARRIVVRSAPGGVMQLPSHGAVVRVSIPGLVSGIHARGAEVYLPPAWFLSPRPRLPVIEMLHGTPGTPEDWTRSGGADRISDAWATTHRGFVPILVMPDINGSFTGDSECTDGAAGAFETYLSLDVPNWVRTHLHAAIARERWAVGGLSEGGTCAIDLALRHPDRWATFLDFGGESHISRSGGAESLFRGTRRQRRDLVKSYDPVRLLRRYRQPPITRGWFEAGASDGRTTREARGLAAVARGRGMTVHLAMRPGGHHSWSVWRACFRDALPWTAARIGTGISMPAGGPKLRDRLVGINRSTWLR